MALSRTRYARLGESHIAYRRFGDGPAELLLLLGLSSHVDGAWEEPGLARFLYRLGSFAQVAMFDFRGCGLSDPLVEAVTLEVLVDDALAVIDAAGLQHPVVLACNETALVAIPFAASRPERVRGLAIVNGTARLMAAADYPFGVTPESAKRFRRDVEAYADDAMALALSAPSKMPDRAFVEWAVRYQHLAASPGTMERLTYLVAATDVRAALPAVRCPAVVLHRSGDRFLPPANGRYLAERIAGAVFVELAGADHLVWVGPDVERLLESVERFTTGAVATSSESRLLATVLFTDIVRSTEQMTAAGDRAWAELLRAHDEASARVVNRHRGRVLKTTGDGILALFDGPSRAVAAGRQLLADLSGLGIALRVGLHTGEVEMDGDDVHGFAVHVAARVMSIAEPGQVVTSRTVRDLTAGSGHRFERRGLTDLKGLPEPIELYTVTG